MTNYMIRRAFQMLIVVLMSTVAIYVLLNIAPGGPLSGLRLSADRRNQVTDQDIARLSAFLGLDKPLALRYLTWLIGDDWLGADWVYVGLTRFKEPRLGRDGEPLYTLNKDTGEKENAYQFTRFWVDPGPPLLNPTYILWVWGEQLDGQESIEIPDPVNPTIKSEITADSYRADEILVKPPITERAPDDVLIAAEVRHVEGERVVLVDKNNNYYVLMTSRDTEFIFPEGEARPRPENGRWANISWLTGFDGLLSNYSQFNGPNRGIFRLDFGTSWRLSPHNPWVNCC